MIGIGLRNPHAVGHSVLSYRVRLVLRGVLLVFRRHPYVLSRLDEAWIMRAVRAMCHKG